MSEENVELVRTAYEAWNRSDLDGVLGVLGPDLEFVTTGLFVGQDHVYSGHDGFKKFWRDFRDTWQSLDLIINELRDCDKRVVALVTFEGRGRGGLEVRRQTGAVHTLRDGLVTRIENYEGWAEALEAAGLSE
jgi:ketosteroid isomerase-like protein